MAAINGKEALMVLRNKRTIAAGAAALLAHGSANGGVAVIISGANIDIEKLKGLL
jgi:threonine dehydratase